MATSSVRMADSGRPRALAVGPDADDELSEAIDDH